MNSVQLTGNLGADPELRTTQAGPVLKLRLATTRSWFDKDQQQRKESTDWHNVSVWGRRGEGLAKVLTKGSHVGIVGRLHSYSYEKDGQKHNGVDVVAEDVYLLGPSRASANGSSRRDPAPSSIVADLPF